MNHSEKELSILEKIHKSTDLVKQRDLAKIADMSLGMTNAILKRLIEKGFVTVKKVNNRNIRYAVSPSGMEEISKRSFRYFKRTIKNVVVYKEAIDDIIKDAKERGYSVINLSGKSDIDFIIEHACSRNRMIFKSTTESYIPESGEFIIISENTEPASLTVLKAADKNSIIYIRDIIS